MRRIGHDIPQQEIIRCTRSIKDVPRGLGPHGARRSVPPDPGLVVGYGLTIVRCGECGTRWTVDFIGTASVRCHASSRTGCMGHASNDGKGW